MIDYKKCEKWKEKYPQGYPSLYGYCPIYGYCMIAAKLIEKCENYIKEG